MSPLNLDRGVAEQKNRLKDPSRQAKRDQPAEPLAVVGGRAPAEAGKSSRADHVERIEGELRLTKERLQARIEELETSKEDLQTVKAELDRRVRDLAKANSDLRNLLESTQIATIFLDNDLCVRSFTPAATDIFHLLDTDMGRSIDHLGSRISYPDLSDDVRKVLTKLDADEREVTSRDGNHYMLASILIAASTISLLARC